jgi:twitching motility protein PilU
MDLSLNLNAVISQRLVLGKDGRRLPAVEIMVNTPFVSELIKKSELGEIKEIMEKGSSVGMQTFDQSLYELYKRDKIDLQDALANADSSSDLEWKINFGGSRGLNKSHEVESLELPSELEERESGAG